MAPTAAAACPAHITHLFARDSTAGTLVSAYTQPSPTSSYSRLRGEANKPHSVERLRLAGRTLLGVWGMQWHCMVAHSSRPPHAPIASLHSPEDLHISDYTPVCLNRMDALQGGMTGGACIM